MLFVFQSHLKFILTNKCTATPFRFFHCFSVCLFVCLFVAAFELVTLYFFSLRETQAVKRGTG